MGLSPSGPSASVAQASLAFLLQIFFCLLILEFWLLSPFAFIAHLVFFGFDSFAISFRILGILFSPSSSNFSFIVECNPC
jgi:hypothetical protein